MSRKLFLFLLVFCALASFASAQVLNEFLYDTQGTDDPTIMFTEIWGAPGTNLAGWTLVGINGNNGDSYLTVPLTGTIPADGYYVVGGSAVANVDQVVTADFQNAGSSSGDDCDGIDLRNASSVVVDHVCYGVCVTPDNCEGEGGTNAPDPFPSQGVNKAIARIPDHQDTDDNGADWTITETLTPGAPNSGVPCDPQYVILSDVRENDANGVPVLMGSFVVVNGIVNVDNYTLDSLTQSSFFMQDEDAGVNIFRGTVPANIVAGDCLTVSGWVGQYNGLTELLSSGSGNCVFQVLRTNHVDPPAPALLNTSSYFEAYEGMLAEIDNVTIISGDWPGQGQFANLTIQDGQGTMIMRIDDDTNIDGSPEPQGAFNVVGIITQYDNTPPHSEGYQITPRSTADIHTLSADNPHDAASAKDFRLLGAYPNPFNSVAQIRYEVGSAKALTLRIFDLLGREVATERLTGLTPGMHTYSWIPIGATGLYFVKLENGANVQTTKVLYLK